MKTAIMITHALCLTISLVAGKAVADEKSPTAEILHWWSSDGEAAALNVFVEAFEARGGTFYDSTNNDQAASRDEAIERLGKGYPSTLTQWNAGRDIKEFFDFGLTNAISEPELVGKLRDNLPGAILDAVSHKGEIIAMPVNIHSENWMWYSNELIDYRDSVISDGWTELLEQGRELAKKEIPLLAVGDQPWQVRILFTSLFLGISRDAYREFYLSENSAVTETEAFIQTLTVFSQLAKYSKSFGDGNWNTQVKAVADNNAGAMFMGDWAKGEFHTLGQTPGREFGCALTAGVDPSLLLVIDSFILGKVTDPTEVSGQALMLDVVSDPEINKQFNVLKGSVSPFIRPAKKDLDPCSAQVYETLANSDSVIPPYASSEMGNFIHQIDGEIYNLWKAAQTSTELESLITTSAAAFKSYLTENAKAKEQAEMTVVGN